MRLLKITGGLLLLVGGAVMLVTPGPGWLAIAAALTILATEWEWARRLLNRVTDSAKKLRG